MKNYNYIFIILLFILAACGEKESEQIKPISGREPASEPAVTSAKFNDTAAIAQTEGRPTIAGMLDPKYLESLLPDDVENFRKLPSDYGWSSTKSAGFSSATCEYLGLKGGNFSITLYDFGRDANIPDDKYFVELPEEVGYETIRVPVKDGVAYQLWDNKKRSGKLRALIKNRFMIKIDVNMMPAHSYGVKSLYDMIKVDELLRK